MLQTHVNLPVTAAVSKTLRYSRSVSTLWRIFAANAPKSPVSRSIRTAIALCSLNGGTTIKVSLRCEDVIPMAVNPVACFQSPVCPVLERSQSFGHSLMTTNFIACSRMIR